MTKLIKLTTMVLLCAFQAPVMAGAVDRTSSAAFQLTEEEQERVLDLFQATDEIITSDGHLQLTYDFESEEKSLGDDFFPLPADRGQKVRWSRDWEGLCEGVSGGIIIADTGQWFHRAVWQPDVQMELTYVSFVGGRRGGMVAAVYAWSKKLRQRVGSNLGTQLLKITGTKATGGLGKAPDIVYEDHHKFGFELKDGNFRTLLNGRPKLETDNKKVLKKLGPGQVGLVWRGTISGVVPELKIRGKIDLDWAADQIPPLRQRLDAHRAEIAAAKR
ncbi:MAG: hypothetical protein VX764_10850 [Planctomycetota bacterium]|nr:hypothetical protein [Planctomycetota bacterium]